jgi:hypothetical protein
MKSVIINAGLRTAVYLALCFACMAQQKPTIPELTDEAEPVPILSGGMAFVPTWDAGQPTLISVVSPVLLAPISRNVVFESRAEFEGDFQRRQGTSGDFTGAINKSLEYAEFDYIGNRYVTVTAGRFLTPFNMFNERLYPNWIRNTQSDPIIFPIGTGSDNGLMLRGSIAVDKNVAVNYTAYFSALSTINHFESERHTGMRAGLFFPRLRFEIGSSFQHQLQDDCLSRYGWHLEWQPLAIPLDLRAEGAYSREEGNGLWLETAYRLRNASSPLLRRIQLVARTQIFHIGTVAVANSDLPTTDAKRTEVGINYYLNDGWKALASYGRTFTPAANSSIWTIGMTYRFVIPLGPLQ